MDEQTKYTDNLILDNPISQVSDDVSIYDSQLRNINNAISLRTECLKDIGSNFIPEEANFNTSPDFVPVFSKPLLFDKKPNYYKRYFVRSQRWIGHVIEINEETFIAKLEDLNQPDTYEIGEFEKNDISREDIELFEVGSVFYWSVGLANYNGQLVKQSLLRFQRINIWNENDYDSCSDRAKDLLNNLNWEV